MDPKKQKNNPFNIATDLLSGIIVGFACGFYLDKWVDTKPLFMIVGSVIGIGAGFRMIWREMKK